MHLLCNLFRAANCALCQLAGARASCGVNCSIARLPTLAGAPRASYPYTLPLLLAEVSPVGGWCAALKPLPAKPAQQQNTHDDTSTSNHSYP